MSALMFLLRFAEKCADTWNSCVVTCLLVLQVGVYMGKRDFVDRVDSVDPVGEFLFCCEIVVRILVNRATNRVELSLNFQFHFYLFKSCNYFSTRWRHPHWSCGIAGEKRSVNNTQFVNVIHHYYMMLVQLRIQFTCRVMSYILGQLGTTFLRFWNQTEWNQSFKI